MHHDLSQSDTVATRYKFKRANELKDKAEEKYYKELRSEKKISNKSEEIVSHIQVGRLREIFHKML